MSESLQNLSSSFADVVEAVAPAVVQVQGHRAPVSGVAVMPDAVLTNARALGRDDNLRVRTHHATALLAELQGWDPATGLALLRVPDLKVDPIQLAKESPRVGNLALAVARSWSNSLTASIGIVSVIGGPLRTGRNRSIEQVIRTTAPMHDGFAGGAFADLNGRLLGIATAAAIRGLGVIIPAPIAMRTAEELMKHGTARRGYLGIASQPVRLSSGQGELAQGEQALLVVGVKGDSPGSKAGMLVGDLILAFDSRPVSDPEDLLALLDSDRVGREVPVRILRGDRAMELHVVVAERGVN